MTIQQACQRLGKSESTIRRWIRSGRLHAEIKDGIYDIQYDLIDEQSLPSQTTIQNDQLIIQLRSENDYLKERIKELEQARERADMITMQLSRQLEQKAIEAPKRSTWLKQLFKKSTRKNQNQHLSVYRKFQPPS